MSRHKPQHQSELPPAFEKITGFDDASGAIQDEVTQTIEQTPQKNLPGEEQTANGHLPAGVFDIFSAPRDGTNIVIMKDGDDGGCVAYWRKTRSRRDGKWMLSGRWAHTLTHMIVDFEPKYWKDYDSVEWKINAEIIDKARIAELESKVAELSRSRA
jgi:hypothetical protein